MRLGNSAYFAVLVLAACAAPVPDSRELGVGFSGYSGYASAEAARNAADAQARRDALVPDNRAIASETLGVLNATRSAGEGAIAAAPPAPASAAGGTETAAAGDAAGEPSGDAVTLNNPGISDEQSFAAVTSRETIQSDAERLKRQRDAYVQIEPGALPERPASEGPNVVAFALSTANHVGEKLYRRSGPSSDARLQRACARYPSPDKAQAAFLDAGGPKRDPKGLDPDGDGFACYWDPAPFRAAKGG